MKMEAPEGAFSPSATRENLADSLREMVEAYWGKEGDGGEMPHCIRRATTLLDDYEHGQ